MTLSTQLHSLLLPFELVEEILYKIPIESLLRFKSICKEWYTLLSDRRFIYKHFDLSHIGFIGGAYTSIQLVNTETQAPMCLLIPDELHNHICVTTVHCDGLLLCSYTKRCRSSKEGTKLAVWNPFSRRVKWIEPSNSYKLFDIYGFGYDNVSRGSYKILRVGESSEVEIYEFKSKHWRSVDAKSCVVYKYCRTAAVSMNGNMYWVVAQQKKMADSKTEAFIQSFDFSTETFKPIACVSQGTDTFRSSFDHRVVLSGFGRDRLSLLHQHKHVKIEVWVTNKVTDAVVSWSKYFNVTRPDTILDSCFDRSFLTYFIHKTNKIMLWCVKADDKKEYTHANVFEMREGQIRKQVEATCKWSYLPSTSFCCVYVPSLVLIPE